MNWSAPDFINKNVISMLCLLIKKIGLGQIVSDIKSETDRRDRVKQIKETESESTITWTRVVQVCPGTRHGNLLTVPLCCLIQWREATMFLCQFLRNRTIIASRAACTICVNGQPWSRGSQRSRTPVHHPLQPVAEEAVSGPVWYWVWPV